MSTAIAVSDAPASLAISPNLDALLEHDERIRQLTTVEVPIVGGELSAPWSAVSMVEEVIHNSLPPPPRRRRPATAPNSPAYHKDTSQWLTMSPSAQSTIRTFIRSPAVSISSTSDNNPFINPAPSMEDLKRLRRPRPSPSSSLASTSAGSSSAEARADSPSTPRPPTRARASPTTRASLTTPRTPTHVPTSSLPEKLAPKRRAGSGARDSCTWRQSGHRKTESEPVQGLNTTIQTPLKLRERARLKGKLLKLKGTGTSYCKQFKALSGENNSKGTESVDEEEGRQFEILEITATAGGVARRPPLSHASLHKSSPSLNLPSGSFSSDAPAAFPSPTFSFTAGRASFLITDDGPLYSPLVIDSPIARPAMTADVERPQQAKRLSGESFIDFSPSPTLELNPQSLEPAPRAPSPPADTRSKSDLSLSRSRSTKPPLPTTPKPNFQRALSVATRGNHRSKSATRPEENMDTLPPTTNLLSPEERAERIRRNRKLEKILGQPAVAQKAHDTLNNTPLSPRHQRGAMSLTTKELDDMKTPTSANWPAAEGTQYLTVNGRRHSTPLSPDDFQFLRELHDGGKTPTSRLSFMDLSDDEADSPSHAAASGASLNTARNRPASIRSIAETVYAEDLEEEDRRRKRDRLAKLHRFLGSRVPPSLVLGSDHPSAHVTPTDDSPYESSISMPWQAPRKSSSSSMSPSSSNEQFERVREDLDNEEKAINVRRAHKMQQVFGVAPPQTLYHTRHSPSPSFPPRTQLAGSVVHEAQTPKTPFDTVPPPLGHRNPNRSPYMKHRSGNPGSDDQVYRPTTPESSMHLIPKSARNSTVYTNYEASINSLNDILDRDDRASLAELHQYLLDDHMQTPPPGAGKRTSTSSAGSRKSDRRRSLPLSVELSPTVSEFERPDVTDFQWRRRKAAKLTQFFGVNHREVIEEVLSSIEHGLEFEQERGAIEAEEAEELLRKIRHIKKKRSSLT